MAEIHFSKSDIFSSVFVRIEEALTEATSKNTRVKISIISQAGGEVLYKAEVEDADHPTLTARFGRLLNALQSFARFFDSKAEHVASKADNWTAFQDLMANQLDKMASESGICLSSGDKDHLIATLTRMVGEGDAVARKGLRLTALRQVQTFLKSDQFLRADHIWKDASGTGELTIQPAAAAGQKNIVGYSNPKTTTAHQPEISPPLMGEFAFDTPEEVETPSYLFSAKSSSYNYYNITVSEHQLQRARERQAEAHVFDVPMIIGRDHRVRDKTLMHSELPEAANRPVGLDLRHSHDDEANAYPLQREHIVHLDGEKAVVAEAEERRAKEKPK